MMEDWHNGLYRKFLRFCDLGTLELVCKVWLSYVPKGHEEKQKAKNQSMVNDRFKKVHIFKEKKAPGYFPSHICSSAPLVYKALKDVIKLKNEF